MLKHGEINPLNVFGLRTVGHCPPHFERVVFDLATSEKRITDWIYENLQGRFWFGEIYSDGFDGKPILSKCAAFEEKSEASYFALFLDKINSWEQQSY